MPESSNGRSPWPWAIAIGLVLVVLINVAMAYVAIQGRDPVVASYRTERR
jgi:hypothetical protein